LVAWTVAGAAHAAGGDVVVAFRVDAAPFSSRGEDGFEGFIAGLCEQAVPRAGYRIAERVELTAASRPDAMEPGRVDLVCDPTTVTVARAGGVDFSPIVFTANSTFLQSARTHVLTDDEIALSDDCLRIRDEEPSLDLVGVGMVVNTTAEATFDLARATRRVGDTLDYGLCRFEFESHAEGVSEVCGGFLSYYFGDLDIMAAELKRQETCTASRSDDFRAYEPYAIAIPSEDDAFRRAVVAAIYGLFADGTALEIYREAFGTDKLSEPLRTLFSVNTVPRGPVPTD
jgi:polar amino acid transport system substrate-binding protein/glutamate/aspartate transport system substrate-binding protein